LYDNCALQSISERRQSTERGQNRPQEFDRYDKLRTISRI